MTDPILETPELESFPEKTPDIVRTTPTYGETFVANMQEYFSAPISGTIAEAQGLPERDLGFNVVQYLIDHGIDPKSPEGRRISQYGLNESSAERVRQLILQEARNQEIFEKAGFAKSILSDPIFLGEVAITGGVIAAARKTARTAVEKSIIGVAKHRQNELLRKKGFRIANSEAVFFEGTSNVLNLANNLEGNADADQALITAATNQLTAQGIASVLGYGVGRVLEKKISGPQQKSVAQSFEESVKNLRELNEGIDAKPKKFSEVKMADALPEVNDDDLLLTGEWFTNSIFYRALPTPVKAVMGKSSKATKDVKLRFMRLVNDGGVLFKLNQLSKSFGESVFQEAGGLSGKWNSIYNELHEIWGEVSTSGNYNIVDMQISDTIEHIKKLRGKESLTFQDFGQHVSDLYINNKTPQTDAESRAVEALRAYFDEWDKMLNDVGLLSGTGTLIKRQGNIEGRIASMENVFDDIIKSNREYLESQVTKLDGFIDTMDKTQKTKGLTDAQLKRREQLLSDKTKLSTALEASYMVRSIDDAIRMIDDLSVTPKQKSAIEKLDGHIAEMKERLDNVNSYLDGSAVEKGLRENFFPRYFDRRKIAANRETFEDILTQHYMEEPFVWGWDEKTKRYVKKMLDNDRASAQRRAKQTTDEILELVDDDGFEQFAYFGKGRSKHLLHRALDIPNSKVQEFMVTDLKQVLVAYNEKVAPKYAFARQFRTENGNPATIDDVIEQNTRDMRKEGIDEAEINRINKEFIGSYDRIVGRVLTKPDGVTSRAAQWLQTAAQWTYLGGAGIAAVADFSNIFMDHQIKTIMKGLASLADDNSITMAKKELQKAGDGMEVVAGTYQMKFMESLSSDPFRSGLTDKINSGFYKFNLLAQMTTLAKTMDGMFRTHTILESAMAVADGGGTKFQKEFLARYNIDPVMAKRIASSPIEKTKNGFILGNTDAWTDKAALRAFRSALKSGVMNRIIMGTPADKPLAMSGKSYLPMHIAKSLGMKESKRVKGYAEIEHPMLAIPFTFYTYTVGALNKVTTNYAQGAVRNPAIHFAVAMFLGYNIVKFRTPDWAWNEMDIEDKILRAFDFSGLAAIYSDMFYRSLEIGMAFDIENPLPFQPKFKEDPDAVGGVVSIFGAPADYAYGFVKSGKEFARGEYGDGTESFVRQIPLVWNVFIKERMNEIKNALGDFARTFE